MNAARLKQTDASNRRTRYGAGFFIWSTSCGGSATQPRSRRKIEPASSQIQRLAAEYHPSGPQQKAGISRRIERRQGAICQANRRVTIGDEVTHVVPLQVWDQKIDSIDNGADRF